MSEFKLKAKTLHPNNLHRQGYDFELLLKKVPNLAEHIIKTEHGRLSIDYSQPEAVLALNKALLLHHYNIKQWTIPAGSLCPPIPGRADYIHHLADILKTNTQFATNKTKPKILDIGTGASGIYALLASAVYGWDCVATDIDQNSLKNVDEILKHNSKLHQHISLRLQKDKHKIFNGVIHSNEYFDFTVCNPPFHASADEAAKSSRTKNQALAKRKNSVPTKHKEVPPLNFGGQSNELWCNGGERLFIKKMIKESSEFADQCRWFTCLVSKFDNLKPSIKQLNKLPVNETKVIEMTQGNKQTRILAWRFQ